MAPTRSIKFEIKNKLPMKYIWLGSIRIKCTKKTPEGEFSNLFTIVEFLRLFGTLDWMVGAMNSTEKLEGSRDHPVVKVRCGLCYRLEPDRVLECSHSYCHICIMRWEKENNTCPGCGKPPINNAESWERIAMPTYSDIAQETWNLLHRMVGRPQRTPLEET